MGALAYGNGQLSLDGHWVERDYIRQVTFVMVDFGRWTEMLISPPERRAESSIRDWDYHKESLFIRQILASLVSLKSTNMLRSILALILFTSVRGQSCPPGYAEDTSGAILKNQKIVWGPCEEWDIPQLECGSVKVPLDYTGASRGVITLSLVRWCADPKKSNGKSIVYNPGGPGGSGIERLINKGPEYMLR